MRIFDKYFGFKCFKSSTVRTPTLGISFDLFNGATNNAKTRRMAVPTRLAPTRVRSRAGRYS